MASVLNRFKDLVLVVSNNVNFRYYSNKIRRSPRPVGKKLAAFSESIAAKGFLRPQRAYNPPADTKDKLRTIFMNAGVSSDPGVPLEDAAVRFTILNDCFKEFNHGVPNSILNSIETTGDIKRFYETPVDATVPLEAMKNVDLPQNLHIQYEYHRFTPDTDTLFNGATAFPKSSTIVTGLKAKKKYQGHIAKKSWP